MLKMLYQSLVSTFLIVVIVCGIYPLIVTVFGKVLFSDQANGSLISGADGKVIGSRLIGQVFAKPEYFHGRPSAAGSGYDAANSSGSNLGPTHQKFADGLQSSIEALLKDNPSIKAGEIPSDLVTASGSGLDPHITPEGAYAQVVRVAQARGFETSKVRSLVESHISGPQFGILGEAVVNVLELNLELDRIAKNK